MIVRVSTALLAGSLWVALWYGVGAIIWYWREYA